MQVALWGCESVRRLERLRHDVEPKEWAETMNFIEGAAAIIGVPLGWMPQPTTKPALSDAVWLARSRQVIYLMRRCGADGRVKYMETLMHRGLDNPDVEPEFLAEEV